MSLERIDWTSERLVKKQISLGLEAAYQANDALKQIQVSQAMIDSAQTPEQLAVSGEDGVKKIVEGWQVEKEIAEAQFSAFDAVVGAMIGRDAPNRKTYPELDIENNWQLSGEGLPLANEVALRNRRGLRLSGEFKQVA